MKKDSLPCFFPFCSSWFSSVREEAAPLMPFPSSLYGVVHLDRPDGVLQRVVSSSLYRSAPSCSPEMELLSGWLGKLPVTGLSFAAEQTRMFGSALPRGYFYLVSAGDDLVRFAGSSTTPRIRMNSLLKGNKTQRSDKY